MKISAVKENELHNEIQEAKKESLGALGITEAEAMMGVVTKDSGLSQIMIGEQQKPLVEEVSIPVNSNDNTQEIAPTSTPEPKKEATSLSNVKDKIKSKTSKKAKKDPKLGL